MSEFVNQKPTLTTSVPDRIHTDFFKEQEDTKKEKETKKNGKANCTTSERI